MVVGQGILTLAQIIFHFRGVFLNGGTHFFRVGALSAGEIRYAKVLAIGGQAEILYLSSKRWTSLLPNTILKKSFKVKTQAGSFVEIVFHSGIEDVARLGENSSLRVLNDPPTRVFFERGELFLLRDKESADHGQTMPLKISTPEASTQLELGGLGIKVSRERTLVRVFGDRAVISDSIHRKAKSRPRTVEEGFKFSSGTRASSASFERMKYVDYRGWQKWIKDWYERKDDLLA